MSATSPIDLSLDSFAPPTPAEAPAARTRSAESSAGEPRPRKPRPRPSQQPSRPSRPEKPGSKISLNPVVEFFRSSNTRHILGIILIVLSLVILIVTFNYLKTGVADQSLVAEKSPMEIVAAGDQVENPGGPAGASLAHMLLVEGLGLGSFISVIYTGFLGLALFGLVRCRFWSFTFKCLFTAIATSIILGLLTYNAETSIHWGGDHGRYINQWLFSVGDVVGAFAVSVMLAGILAVIYIQQLRAFFRNITGSVAKAREAMASAAAAGRRPDTSLADVPEAATDESGTEPVHRADIPVTAPIVGFNIDDEEQAEPTPATIAVTPAVADVPQVPVSVTTPEHEIPAQETVQQAATTPETPAEPIFTVNSNPIGEVPAGQQSSPSQPETELEPFNIRDELSHYRFPGVDLLVDRPAKTSIDPNEQQENKDLIVKTLADYGIAISRIEATVGPTVTLYEIVPAEGVRIAQIKRLEDDIALQLAALGIRIIAPIPGKGTVGIEVPNREPQTVSMFSVINSRKFRECKMALPMALGATINNDIFIEDLARMPHLLVAGATGQGKSVGLNCIIASLLYKKHPGELKFVLIDPKMVEFSLYSRIQHHYLAKLPDEEEPIVTEPSKALTILQSLCIEMDNRYDLLKSAGVRNLEEYNRKFTQRRLNPEKGHKFLPYIVVVVDEFADLIMTAGKDISVHIARIAQKARAVGMHMIIATQRPSTDIITGMIKANFPGRIAFRVSQMVDSRTILDQPGANRLIGRGDLLFSHNSKLERVQCAFIDTPEVEAIVNHIDNQIGYPTAYLLPEPKNEGAVAPGSIDLSRRDELFDDCARFVVTQGTTASTSMLQRRFAIGYNKAGKIMDQMEAAGIVGPADGQKPRSILIDQIALEDLLKTL